MTAAPALISRTQAFHQGLKYYFSGTPCERGHVAYRSVRSGLCLDCPRHTKQRPYNAAQRPYDAAYYAAYYVKNRDRMRETGAIWRAANRETIRAKAEEYRDNHPRVVKAKPRKIVEPKEKTKRTAEGFHTQDDVSRILKMQNGRCAYCSAVVWHGYHVDHITPLARGGTQWPRNLQITCAFCNLSKNARDPLEFARSIGLLL